MKTIISLRILKTDKLILESLSDDKVCHVSDLIRLGIKKVISESNEM